MKQSEYLKEDVNEWIDERTGVRVSERWVNGYLIQDLSVNKRGVTVDWIIEEWMSKGKMN